MNDRIVVVALALVVALSGAEAVAQEEGGKVCIEFVEMLERAVPEEVGDPGLVERLLRPQTEGEPLSARFEPERAAEVLGDRFERTVPCPSRRPDGKDAAELCNQEGSELEFQLERGEVTYLNPSRSFRATSGTENRVGEDRAVQVAKETFAGLGLPTSQFAPDVEVRTLVAAGRDPAGEMEPFRVPAELHVRFMRQMARVPVFDSAAKAAIDAEGRVARLHLRWPDFRLAPGLTAEAAPKRRETILGVARILSAEAHCDGISRIDAFVAYVPGAQLEVPEAAEDGEAEPGSSTFVPGLVIYATPPEPKEDSGEIAMPGRQIAVPLVSFAQLGDRGRGSGDEPQ